MDKLHGTSAPDEDVSVAERTGNWTLYLQCVRRMLPYFHAAGHLAYAKAARLYLQQMNSLESKMTETVH